MNLKGKKAIVTGGTRGIGKAIVFDLALNGCDVVFTYHSSAEAAKAIESESSKFNVQLLRHKADAASFSEAEETVNFALEKFGTFDILVNNAGIAKDNLLLRMSEEDFDKVIKSNLKSVFNYTKASIKTMLGKRSGKIVNISSVVALIGNPGQANYAASKAGILGFTKSTAREFSSRNINVNAVTPGYISTDMTERLNDKQKEALISLVPLKKLGTPENVAKLVSFLCSSDSDYITGQVISVDGGISM